MHLAAIKMCLPKFTFYLYFGFFFLGYIWVFAVLFYNAWENGNKNKLSLLSRHYAAKETEEFSVLRPLINTEFRPVPYFDLSKPMPFKSVEPFCREMVTDPKFHLCLHDPNIDKGISAHINVYREWEQELSGELKSVLLKHPNSIFVDVGANIGYYSLLAAKLGFSVIAIEPYVDHLTLFKQSAQMNHLTSKIRTIAAVVSDTRENLTLAEDPENFGGRFVVATDRQKFVFRSRKQSSFPTILLDDLLTVPPFGDDTLISAESNALNREKDKIAGTEIVMKIDIQGHECHAIRGAQNLIEQVVVSPIFMEWEESRKLEGNLPCLMDMLQILEVHGYRAFTLDGKMIVKLDPKDLSVPQDIVWRKVVK